MSRAVIRFTLVVYCIAIFLVLDFIYSSFLHDEVHSPRYPHTAYHHALLPNYDGYDNWGDNRYKFYTNSRGFRDGAVRDVPATPTTHRVLLIGDSFTEGTGVRFEDSFAGQLYSAGMQRTEKIEFLNAGVRSYSPTLYYRKIKYLVEHGLRFDKVVVLSDASDVYDDATKYFCHDDDPRYLPYCDANEREIFASLCEAGSENNRPSCSQGERFAYARTELAARLTRHFVVTDTIRATAKFRIQAWLGNQKKRVLAPSTETHWLFPNTDGEREYAPLGFEGGVARSLQNMQLLADLLKKNHIPLTIVVYPWPAQLALGDRDSRQIELWRTFCASNCAAFINLFPAFFAEAATHEDWYERLFISGDFHYSAAGHRLMFRTLADHMLRQN